MDSSRSTMSYVEKHLIEGETLVYETGLHWVVLVRSIFLALCFGVPGVVLLVLYAENRGDQGSRTSTAMMAGGIILLVVAVICIIAGIVKRNATEMAVTNKRVIVKVGLATRKTFELLLQKVESIGVEESVIGRILGYGSVVVDGTGGSHELFDRVAHPIEFRKQVQQQIERLLDRSR
jgi:uncharacterized membrane protein YdbT with pleckstrin-like domain